MPKVKLLSLLLIFLVLASCVRMKPEELTANQQVDEILADLEEAIGPLDFDKLEDLLADEVILDMQPTDYDDHEKLKEFFGDFDSIESAELIENTDERIQSDSTIIISAELYMQLIKGDNMITDTSDLYITLERQDNRWAATDWAISSMVRESNSTVEQAPLDDPEQIVDVLIHAFQTEDFAELHNLFSHTLTTTDGLSVHYYRNNQIFINALEDDFSLVIINDLQLTNRSFNLYNNQLIVTGNLQIDFNYNNQQQIETVPFELAISQYTNGWLITKITYSRKFFGLIEN